MPVFDLVTTNDNSETVLSVMQRAIGATQAQVESYIAAVKAGKPTPILLINGAQSGDRIPENMLAMYEQFYQQAESVIHTTGLSYRDSLVKGGSAPYDGHS